MNSDKNVQTEYESYELGEFIFRNYILTDVKIDRSSAKTLRERREIRVHSKSKTSENSWRASYPAL